MKKFTVTHDLGCSAKRFWELFFDPEFTRQMLTEGLGFPKVDVKELDQTEGKKSREMYVVPKLDLPGPVAKLLGPGLAYTEVGTFDEASETWEFTNRLSTLSERVRLGGSVHLEDAGPDKCRRVADLWVEAKILGLGGAIERATEKSLRDGWDQGAAFINRHVAKG